MKRFIDAYTTVAVLFLNTLLLCLCLNVALFTYGQARPSALQQPTATPRGEDFVELRALPFGTLDEYLLLRMAHPALTDEQILWLQLESANMIQQCDPVTYFRERPYKGRFFEVHEVGFRAIENQPPWPPDPASFVVFVFGGSTTFGTGVRNQDTIPSHLHYYLNLGGQSIAVYNFGNGAFISQQERLRFAHLLEQGFIPDAVIFIDGLNDFGYWGFETQGRQPCQNTERLRLQNSVICRPDEFCTPVQKWLTTRLVQPEPDLITTALQGAEMPALDDEAANWAVIESWLANKSQIEALAAANGIQSLFVMQPVPSYAYDLQYHPFLDDLAQMGRTGRSHWGYELWNEWYAGGGAETQNVLNLSLMIENIQDNIWVDAVHYTAAFNSLLARRIADEIQTRAWLPD